MQKTKKGIISTFIRPGNNRVPLSLIPTFAVPLLIVLPVICIAHTRLPCPLREDCLFLGKGLDFPTLADVLKMSNIEHLSNCRNVALCGGENQGTHPETDILGALSYFSATEEACEPHTGGLRNEPHRDRELSAAENVETKPGKGRPFLSGIGRS